MQQITCKTYIYTVAGNRGAIEALAPPEKRVGGLAHPLPLLQKICDENYDESGK